MRWSKVRKLVEESFVPSVRGRVRLHTTTFGACTCGKGSIHIDGQTLAKFNTIVHYTRYRDHIDGYPPIPIDQRSPNLLVERGEFSRQDLYRACWSYLHSSINESIESDNPLILSLAVLSARVGRNRLRRVASRDLHPLTRALLEFRLEAEAAGASRQVTVTASDRALKLRV